MILMKCGHVANETCPVCFPDPNSYTPVDEVPDLTGRLARCDYYISCSKELPSSLGLAFFEYRPNDTYDRFYCGCRGWE
jgi:hypothetical protein